MQPSEETLKPERRVFDLSGNRNPKAFLETLALMSKGDEITYHSGLYAGGTHKAAAMEAYEAGLVTLFQRRAGTDGDQRFSYVARRTEKKGAKK
jgi:hypothetical protein